MDMTRCRVAGMIRPVELKAWDTVAVDTPAAFATSWMVIR